MARRNEHTKEEIKEMAINVGHNIIKNEGFKSFSIRKVAREIGYTVGTLYNVFLNQDDLICHINGKTLDQLESFMNKNFKNVNCVKENIKQLGEIYIKFANSNYNSWEVLFEYDTNSIEWYQEKVQNIFNPIEDILKDFCGQDSKKHAKILWASIHGICVLNIKQKLNIEGIKRIEELTDCLVENYLNGL